MARLLVLTALLLTLAACSSPPSITMEEYWKRVTVASADQFLIFSLVEEECDWPTMEFQRVMLTDKVYQEAAFAVMRADIEFNEALLAQRIVLSFFAVDTDEHAWRTLAPAAKKYLVATEALVPALLDVASRVACDVSDRLKADQEARETLPLPPVTPLPHQAAGDEQVIEMWQDRQEHLDAQNDFQAALQRVFEEKWEDGVEEGPEHEAFCRDAAEWKAKLTAAMEYVEEFRQLSPQTVDFNFDLRQLESNAKQDMESLANECAFR